MLFYGRLILILIGVSEKPEICITSTSQNDSRDPGHIIGYTSSGSCQNILAIVFPYITAKTCAVSYEFARISASILGEKEEMNKKKPGSFIDSSRIVA